MQQESLQKMFSSLTVKEATQQHGLDQNICSSDYQAGWEI